MRESSDTAQTLYHAQRTEMCVKIQTVKAEISYYSNKVMHTYKRIKHYLWQQQNTLPSMLSIWKLSRSKRTITPTVWALQTDIAYIYYHKQVTINLILTSHQVRKTYEQLQVTGKLVGDCPSRGVHVCRNGYIHTHTRLTALFRDYPGEPVPERQNQSGFYRSKRRWVAVASAGPYASLHLAPDR